MSRPEVFAPPQVFYNEEEASKYDRGGRIREIQTQMTERVVELCLLPEHAYVLDVGSGSGISGEVLTDQGHEWVGVDISRPMLNVAVHNEIQGDVILSDIGHALRFRPGVFDGAISVSTLQWLCNADKKIHEPHKRLLCFFRWLLQVLRKGARAVFQFYPSCSAQAEIITNAAMRAGFSGGLVVDYPNSAKAKKYYLCLWSGLTGQTRLPPNLPEAPIQEAEDNAVENTNRRRENRRKPQKQSTNRQWILRKKQRQRQQGYKVRPDTKFTGRKRKDKF